MASKNICKQFIWSDNKVELLDIDTASDNIKVKRGAVFPYSTWEMLLQQRKSTFVIDGEDIFIDLPKDIKINSLHDFTDVYVESSYEDSCDITRCMAFKKPGDETLYLASISAKTELMVWNELCKKHNLVTSRGKQPYLVTLSVFCSPDYLHTKTNLAVALQKILTTSSKTEWLWTDPTRNIMTHRKTIELSKEAARDPKQKQRETKADRKRKQEQVEQELREQLRTPERPTTVRSTLATPTDQSTSNEVPPPVQPKKLKTGNTIRITPATTNHLSLNVTASPAKKGHSHLPAPEIPVMSDAGKTPVLDIEPMQVDEPNIAALDAYLDNEQGKDIARELALKIARNNANTQRLMAQIMGNMATDKELFAQFLSL